MVASTPHVLASAPVTLQLSYASSDPDGDVYQTEMTALSLSGGSLPSNVQIRESPTLASTGQTRIKAVGGGHMIDSFFDIYLEVSTDGGVSWWPAGQLARVVLKPDPALVPAVAAPRDVLPMPNGQELCSGVWAQYPGSIIIRDFRHKRPTLWLTPPLAGASQTHTFDSQLDFQLSMDGGVSFTARRAPAVMEFQIRNVREFQGRTTYDTEMLQLTIAGGDLPAGVMIRESPTRASQGGVSMVAGGGGGGAGGGAAISSFFDIWTEVSTDGGRIVGAGDEWSGARGAGADCAGAYLPERRLASAFGWIRGGADPVCHV